MAWALPLGELPLFGEKRAALEAAGLRAELRLDAGADAASALRREWLPAARALCLNDAELYYLEAEEATFTAQISPRNEAASLALLLDVLRAASGACAMPSRRQWLRWHAPRPPLTLLLARAVRRTQTTAGAQRWPP
jgi:hypothetical protein